MYRRMNCLVGIERRQLQWILLSHLIALAAGIEYFCRVFGMLKSPPLDDYILVIYFSMFAFALVKYQLLSIQVVIRRSLVYSLLIAWITALYLVMVLVAEKWFQAFLGYSSVYTTVVVAFLIAVFFNPLRDRIQWLVDRAFYSATTAELAGQRERLLEQVRRGDQMKQVATLAAGMAHEIRNPLTSIKTFAHSLPEKYQDAVYREKFSRIMSQEVERIDLLVQRLLDFAKPASPTLQPTQLSSLISETVDLMEGALLNGRVQVRTHLSDSNEVAIDRAQIQQVLMNLLLNSKEAMRDGGTIDIETTRRNGHVSLTIADSGCGISKKALGEVLDPFYSTKPNGTGLGLSIVDSIVRAHGGRIKIESEIGKGTTVRVDLPLGGDNEASTHTDRG
jgi:signal transduction histidine kinase